MNEEQARWLARFGDALRTLADMTVDLAAIAGLAYVAISADPGIATEMGGFMVSVAIGKRVTDAYTASNG